MKMRSRFALAAIPVLAAVTAALAVLVPDLASAMPFGFADLGLDGLMLAEPAALLALRSRLTELETRAANKLAEIGDDTSAEDARRIEAEHQSITQEIDGVRGEIRTAEADAAAAHQSRQDDPGESQSGHQGNAPDHQRGGSPAQHPPSQQPAQIDQSLVTRSAQQAVLDEHERIDAIRAAARVFQLPDEFVQQHIRAFTPLDGFRAAAFQEVQRRAATQPIFSHVETRGLADERETMRRGMRDALAARMALANRQHGDPEVQIPEHAQPYASMEIAEMAAESLGHRGPIRTHRQVHELLERAFHTTSDFPGIFTDAMNVRLLARYEAAQPTYRMLATRGTAADFRDMHVVRAGDFPALQPVNEAGEIKGGTFGESKEIFRVDPYGVRFQITRQMIINDQLGAIDQVLASSGVRVADWENMKFFELLVQAGGAGFGPVLRTGNRRMFHADHANLNADGSQIDVTGIGAGRAAMARQTTLDGIKANFQPSVLLVSPDQITRAEQLLTLITPNRPVNAVPESIRRLTPVSDANLEGLPWYLFADPAVAPVFMYGYLEGFEGPRLTAEETFSVQGQRVKLEHDFGVTGIDFRGAYRDAGAEPPTE